MLAAPCNVTVQSHSNPSWIRLIAGTKTLQQNYLRRLSDDIFMCCGESCGRHGGRVSLSLWRCQEGETHTPVRTVHAGLSVHCWQLSWVCVCVCEPLMSSNEICRTHWKEIVPLSAFVLCCQHVYSVHLTRHRRRFCVWNPTDSSWKRSNLNPFQLVSVLSDQSAAFEAKEAGGTTSFHWPWNCANWNCE